MRSCAMTVCVCVCVCEVMVAAQDDACNRARMHAHVYK